MKKQKKQDLLTIVIILLIIALVMLVASIIYEEMINMGKQQIQNTSYPEVKVDEENTTIENNQTPIEVEKQEEQQEEVEKTENNQEFVGEEENNKEETSQSKDEKAIDLVKKEWGDDNSVTFSIEQKKGNIYYIAVKSDNTSTAWYEVDTETWEVSEY